MVRLGPDLFGTFVPRKAKGTDRRGGKKLEYKGAIRNPGKRQIMSGKLLYF